MAVFRQWLDSLPAPNGVLERFQRLGRNSLLNDASPTRALEAWRLTDLKRLEHLFELPLHSNQDVLDEKKLTIIPDKPGNGLRITLDSDCDTSDSLKLPPGIRKLNALELEAHLGNSLKSCSLNCDWPVAINHASATQVLGLEIQGQDLPPLELVMEAKPCALSPTRVILILKEQAKLELLQVAIGAEEAAQSHLIEIHLGQGSELQHGWLGFGKHQSSLLVNMAITQEARSNYFITAVQHGWFLARMEPHIVQVHGHANTTMRGLQLATNQSQIATHSSIRFDGPEGSLDQLQKSVAAEKSHCIFNGAIHVPRIAQKTNAAQLSRNLLLSERARIDTKPELKIIADDVRCAHGATVSQLQEEELFYLRSRGIEATTATSLLLKGYCQEIFNSLPVEANRWERLITLLESMQA